MQQTSPFRWSNMQAITFACSVLFVILDLCQAQNDDNGSSLYTRRYEHLDIDTILASPRLVTNYVECLLNKKPCAPEGKALKRILPEALRTKCGRCWPSQKEGALKVITSLYYNYPDYYKALREKWDPTGEYNRRFEEYLRDQKFNSIGGNSDTEPGEQAQGSSVSITITQRPTRQDDVSPSGGEPDISNRFGAEDNGGYEYENPKPTTLPSVERPQALPQQPQRPQTQRPPQPTQRPQPQPQPTPSPAPSRRPSNGGSSQSAGSSPQPSNSGSNTIPTHTWTHNTLPVPGLTTTTTYYLKTQNPVLNIINRITMKFANTAEFIAGMLRGAVPQPLPQAKKHKADPHRTFCDRLRKTLLSYTNTRTVNRHRRY